jgi:hypothetical protein
MKTYMPFGNYIFKRYGRIRISPTSPYDPLAVNTSEVIRAKRIEKKSILEKKAKSKQKI